MTPDPKVAPKLETVRGWCERLAKPVEVVELEMADGSEQPALEVEHGDHDVWVIDGPAEVVDLVYAFYLTDTEIDEFDRMDPDERDALMADLEYALLEGRSAYRLYHDSEERFTGFSMTQVLHVPDDPDDPDRLVQRLSDAVQELVVTGLRGANMLGMPWQDDDRVDRPQGGEPHTGMYG